MRRLTKTGSSKLNADSQRLVSLALEMFYASSFLESEFCRKKLEVLVFRLLQARKQAVLNDAIEYLFTVSKKQGQVEISQFNAMPEYDFQYHIFRDKENSGETYKYTIEKEKVW